MLPAEPARSPQLDVLAIVLNYRNAESSLRAAEAVTRGSVRPRAVVLIDNNSMDGSSDILAAWVDGMNASAKSAGTTFMYVGRPLNDGYGAGNNVGLRLARKMGIAWAWILNHDTEPDMHALEQLWRATALNDVAAISGTLVADDGRTPLCVGGAHYEALLTRTRPLSRVDFEDQGETLHAPQRLSYLAGACLLVRVSALADIGYLEESHFLFFEELVLARELAEAGWRMAVVPDALVVHRQGLASGAHADLVAKAPSAAYYANRAVVLYARRYAPWSLPTALLARLSHVALVFALGHRRVGWAAARGLWDGLANRRGPNF